MKRFDLSRLNAIIVPLIVGAVMLLALGAYIFGGLQSVGSFAQSWFPNVPTQVFQTAPFALMIIALLLVSNDAIDRFFSGLPVSHKIWQSLRGTPPGALSTAFEQE
ncbi:MAG: hypothetical protein KGJ80_08445 [Chloroflexota bacterium]|nr:hypothetical protein [Chloroflexota bacterium]